MKGPKDLAFINFRMAFHIFVSMAMMGDNALTLERVQDNLR